MTFEKWVDFSVWQGRVSRMVLGRMKDDNVRGVCVGSWHGLSANPYVEDILLDARDLGLGTATYAVVNARDGKQTIGLARDACGAAWPHLSFVAIDVEIRGVTLQIIRDARKHIEVLGQTPWLYSARWFLSWWAQELGSSPNAGFMEGLPLWYALYNGRADLDSDPDLGLWGPWRGPVAGHQYTGSTSAYGTTVDFNVFDSELVRRTTPPASPPPPPDEEDKLMGKILDLATAFGRELEAEIARAKALPVPIKGDTGKTGATGPAGSPGGGAAPNTYTVKPGDTLSGIAGQFGTTWQALYKLNLGVIGSDPDLIQPGMVLVLP